MSGQKGRVLVSVGLRARSVAAGREGEKSHADIGDPRADV